MKTSLHRLLPLLACAAGSLFALSLASAQTLVTNPGFELGSTTPTGWGTVVGTTGATTNWVTGTAGGTVYEGIHAVSITNPNKDTYTARWNSLSSSRLTMIGGATYTISLYALGTALDLTGGINAQDGFNVGLVYYDSSNTLISTWSSTAASFTSNDVWTPFSFTSDAAPANAVTAVLQLVYRRPLGVTSGTDATITWDNVNVYAVPEPSVALLLGAGLGTVIFLRRRTSR